MLDCVLAEALWHIGYMSAHIDGVIQRLLGYFGKADMVVRKARQDSGVIPYCNNGRA